MMIFTSNDSWHGIFADDWPTFEPTRVYFDLTQPNIELKMHTIKHTFQKGVESSFECLNNMAKTFNCSHVCSYITFGSLPLCKTSVEFYCNFVQMFVNGKSDLNKCLSPKETLTFSTYTLAPQIYEPQSKVTKVTIKLHYVTMEVREELDVITTVEFIGNFGGSMGMFFGFSFASPLLLGLNQMINRFFEN